MGARLLLPWTVVQTPPHPVTTTAEGLGRGWQPASTPTSKASSAVFPTLNLSQHCNLDLTFSVLDLLQHLHRTVLKTGGIGGGGGF